MVVTTFVSVISFKDIPIIDVKAKDSSGNIYQVEIQLSTYPGLGEQMLYTWCDLYAEPPTGGK